MGEINIHDLAAQLKEDKLALVDSFTRRDLEFMDENQSAIRSMLRDAFRHDDIKVTFTIKGKTITQTTIERTIVSEAFH